MLAQYALAGLTQEEWDWVMNGTVQSPSGASISVSDTNSLLSTIKEIFQIYGTYEMQRALNDINIERAKQGMPPISAADAGVGVGIGLDPQSRQMIYFIGAGIALALYFGLRGSR